MLQHECKLGLSSGYKKRHYRFLIETLKLCKSYYPTQMPVIDEEKLYDKVLGPGKNICAFECIEQFAAQATFDEDSIGVNS